MLEGLPGPLPPGERVLWQGRPCSQTLARRAFQVRKLAVYFALLLVWYLASALTSGEDARTAMLATLRMTGIALVPLALVYAYSWATSRSTTYTITDRRLVMSIGIALPMTINLPFSKVVSAAVEMFHGGHGSIVLTLTPTDRLAYLMLWPHARPWRMARAEPMLRGIPDAARVSQTLARALAASAGVSVQAVPINSAASQAARPQISALA
jgi:hypothetical protein